MCICVCVCANMDTSMYLLTFMHVDTMSEEKIGKPPKSTAMSLMMIMRRKFQKFAILRRPVCECFHAMESPNWSV